MKKTLLLALVVPTAGAFAQQLPATAILPAQPSTPSVAGSDQPHTAAPAGQPGFQQPGQPHTAAPAGQPGFHQLGQPHTAAPAGQPGFQQPAQPHSAAPAGQPGFHQPGQPHTAAPAGQHVPHQSPVPDPHGPDHEADHDEHIGFVIGIDPENEIVRIQTKNGPIMLKVTEDSELLFPGLHQGPAFDIEPAKFEGNVKGKMVRISSRGGKVDHIEPLK